jgi:hypothetical protein
MNPTTNTEAGAVADVAGWRTVDSAPRDGTEFQGWVKSINEPLGWWEPKCRLNPETEAFEIWDRVDYDQDGWGCYGHVDPVAWMPEPLAPAHLSEQGATAS